MSGTNFLYASSFKNREATYLVASTQWELKLKPQQQLVTMSSLMASSSSSCSWAFNRTLLPTGDGPHNQLRCSSSSSSHRPRNFLPLRVLGESKETKSSPDDIKERSESDRLVDSMDFGELCNEFECLSSPAVESTARQLARDILELREGNRALGSYSISVKYKDPVRSFTGREKYKRQLWAIDALENPSVTVQEMVMLSTSMLSIKWTLRGKPKNPVFALGGELILRVNSQFTLNQISGQVTEHEESWDLSSSSALAQGYFWISRSLFSVIESGKDRIDDAKNMTSNFSTDKENMEVYPDPSGDPTKFFQGDDGLQRDTYQIALFLAVVYFVVQFLRTTL